jgi:hypothetical protein
MRRVPWFGQADGEEQHLPTIRRHEPSINAVLRNATHAIIGKRHLFAAKFKSCCA